MVLAVISLVLLFLLPIIELPGVGELVAGKLVPAAEAAIPDDPDDPEPGPVPERTRGFVPEPVG
jgi:hypothetical protein